MILPVSTLSPFASTRALNASLFGPSANGISTLVSPTFIVAPSALIKRTPTPLEVPVFANNSLAVVSGVPVKVTLTLLTAGKTTWSLESLTSPKSQFSKAIFY